MKIKCQEHYDKVAEYAKSIGDTTFQNCIERLKQWEKNSGGRYEIELYYDFAPYSFGFAERTPDGRNGIVGGLLYNLLFFKARFRKFINESIKQK